MTLLREDRASSPDDAVEVELAVSARMAWRAAWLLAAPSVETASVPLNATPPSMASAVATAGVSDGGKAGIGIGVTMLARRAFATRRARAAAIKAGLRGPPSASSAPGVWEVLLLRSDMSEAETKTYNCCAEKVAVRTSLRC